MNCELLSTNVVFLNRNLAELASRYEAEARTIREFISGIKVTDEKVLVGSCLDANVRRLVMDGFNTSDRLSAATTAMMAASHIVEGR